jgi:septum formation protein
METIYLASQSPRRAALLAQMGVPYRVIGAPVDERIEGKPEDCVMELARRKAESGAAEARRGWVLAADTLVFLDGERLGKPRSEEEAVGMLLRLSGREHRVLTGMCLKNAATGEEYARVDGARIAFGEMTREEIEDYVRGGEPMDKAGAYGIQGKGGAFIREIAGDYYATVGLSLYGLRALLKRAGLQ